MSNWVAEKLILEMTKRNFFLSSSNVLILGFTFKENCPDIRNTKVYDLIKTLEEYNLNIDIVDPWVNPIEAENVYGIKIKKSYSKKTKYDAIVCTVAHNEFINKKKLDWENIINKNGIIFDLKGIVPRELNALRI